MLHWREMRARYLQVGPYGIWAAAIILLAVAIRVALIALGWPQLDSDEGTMGIMGMHILSHGELPIFFYAQGYMGAFEAYLAAAVFSLFGVSAFTLRIGLILLFAIFLVGMYLLTSLLYTKGWALVTLGFLCLGSAPILAREVVAIGGYPETLMFGTFLLLLALWLALSSRPDFSMRNQWRRLLVYGVWGLIAGVAFWTDALIVPFILTGGLLILVFCWRELLGWATLLLLVGALVGVSPMIVYNLTALPGKDTLTYLKMIQAAENIHLFSPAERFLLQLKGTFLISMPGATGANPLCYSYSWDVAAIRLGSIHQIRCTLMHTGWSLGVVLLWTVAVIFTLWRLWHLYRSSSRSGTSVERQQIVRYSGRFVLLLNAVFVLALFLFSPASAYFPLPDMRYLIGLLVSIPAVLWPLWSSTSLAKPLALRLSKVMVAVKSIQLQRALLFLIGVVFLLGTVNTFVGDSTTPPLSARHDTFAIVGVYRYLGVPSTRVYNREEAALIQNLLRIGATHIYSDYWTCDRVVFRSQEQIICSVGRFGLGKIRPYQDRYEPYCNIVMNDPHSAYVFQVGSAEAAYMQRRWTAAKEQYDRYSFNGYLVIRPRQPIPNGWRCIPG